MTWRWPLAVAALLAATGCGGVESVSGGGKGRNEDPSCVPTDRFFSQQVWSFMGQQCYACHSATGTARGSDLVLQPSSQPDYLRINLEIVQRVARPEIDGVSVLLLKPSAQMDHGGGVQLRTDSAEYKALEELVRRFKEPVDCGTRDDDQALAGALLLDEGETLRKAALALVGRLPTVEEEARVEDGGLLALETVLDEMLTEEAFYDRLREGWNDLFLTDRYLSGTRAIDLLDTADYPNRTWYLPPEGTPDVDEAEVARLRRLTNVAVAREPLELLVHVVRNGKPFTEILTADYRLVNPFSARTYGVDLRFDDANDPNEWREGRVPGVEHAGVLTSPMFLNRFPTTATNRNRARARMVYRFFLATDVLKLAERPVDPTSIEDHNPTLYNPACTVCHQSLDPVAGAFMNWDARGRYRPAEEGWFPDMLPPGYRDASVPNADRSRSLQWLATRLVEDPLFVTSTVHHTWTLLTGQLPLQPPADPSDPTAAAQLEAWEAQNDFFQQVGRDFVEDGYDYRTVVKRLVLGPYYRIHDLELYAKRTERFADLGASRLLAPERLDRKIEAVTGYPWQQNATSTGYLLDTNHFRIFYGGIDSDQIVDRITAPNGVMANVAARMANEMACRSVPRDFVLDAADRRLFPAVEIAYEPEDANGFEIPGAVDAIKENIRWLHQRVLGETLYPGDPELDRTWQLFYDTWKEGKQAVAAGATDVSLPNACRVRTDFFTGENLPDAMRLERDAGYTVRAWMAVMTYLLLDYRFLYE